MGSRAPHPKVVAAGSGAGLGVLITALVNALAGAHLTAAEAGAVSTVLSLLAGYAAPASRRRRPPKQHPQPQPPGPAQPTIMFDSTVLADIPATSSEPFLVGAYVGGRWATAASAIARYGRERVVTIAVSEAEDADALDCERGDVDPADTPAIIRWLHRQLGRSGGLPILYASVSSLNSIVAALDIAGIPRGRYLVWSAHYGAGRHLCAPGCYPTNTVKADATQWANDPRANLDTSLIAPHFDLWRHRV